MRTRQKIKIPKGLKYLFWDIDTTNLDCEQYKQFIIERILEKGDFNAVSWAIHTYKIDTIREIIYTPINLSRQTINFWKGYFKYCEII